MSELTKILGNGHYVYYKTLQQSKLLSSVYTAGAARVASISSMLNNNKDMAESDQYLQFQDFMTSYIAKMKSIASSLRSNEIAYIEMVANKSKDILSDENIKRLHQLSTKTGLKESDYQELLLALNKVQYQDNISRLESTMKEQIYNIETLQNNLKALKEINPQRYDQLKSDYMNKYGKYIQEYTAVVRSAIKEKFKWKKMTKVQSMASTINSVLDNLASDPQIEPIIKELWVKNPEATSITITPRDNAAFTGIVDIVVDRVLAAKKGEGATKISKSIIEDIKSKKLVIPPIEQQQAFKVATKKDTSKISLEDVVQSASKSIITLLRESANAREMLESFFPDNPKKVKAILKDLKDLEKLLQDVPSDKIKSTIKKFKVNGEGITFEEQLRSELKDTMHYKKISEAIENGLKLKDIKSDNKYNTVLSDRLRTEMQNSFSIKIDKSGLAELISERVPDLGERIFSGVPGNAINLKDDVWCAFRLKNASSIIEDSLEEDEELNDLLSQIDTIIKDKFSTYIEDYSKTTEKKSRGQTDVARANELYIEKIQPIIDLYEKVKEESPDLFKKLQDYMKDGGHFLESISVKEYDLYDNDIGFHAGTLGPSISHILENIYNMYAAGGITPIDVKTLDFALLNCSDAAAGGSGLRKSLEMYLLGGAALMVFDEGMGNAQQYLKNMESEITSILPKNLNLYFLNELYVPSSYIIESIAQNLEAFYNHEIQDEMNNIQQRGHVVIANVPQQYVQDQNVISEFEKTAKIVRDATTIQFIFMGGMLDIFKNLSKAFDTP